MALGMVELQGTINRSQDIQYFQHNENERGLVYQENQTLSMEQKVEQDNNSVHEKEDAAAETDDNERKGNGYGGDGGKKRRTKSEFPEDRIIEKRAMSFDITI